MRRPRSLQLRLGLAVGVLVTLLWIGGALVSARSVREEMNEVFDSALQEMGQRLLPLAVAEVMGREGAVGVQIVPFVRPHDEHFTYVVRDASGQILLQSHLADPTVFPPFEGTGFRDTERFRIYSDSALRGSVTISVAEPLDHRDEAAREVQMGLFSPLGLLVPLSLLGIVLALRLGFAPLRRFRLRLEKRGASDLSPVEVADLPLEVRPLGDTLNGLLARLDAAFQAERSFAANAAHELRTPLAGAIAQAQRLQAETTDPKSAARAAEIETGLKRLTRLSEGLMQLARAEGGKLRVAQVQDLRPVLDLVARDAARHPGAMPVRLDMPEMPVLSDLDPDLFAILCRNLIENAQRHGTPGTEVVVRFEPGGRLRVENDCEPVPTELLDRLGTRFLRAPAAGKGSGLGLAIAHAIIARAEGDLKLTSPVEGRQRGFAATVSLHLLGDPQA